MSLRNLLDVIIHSRRCWPIAVIVYFFDLVLVLAADPPSHIIDVGNLMSVIDAQHTTLQLQIQPRSEERHLVSSCATPLLPEWHLVLR